MDENGRRSNHRVSQEFACSLNGEEEHVEGQIEITINHIENIMRNENFVIKFVVEHGSAVIGASDLVYIASNYESLEAMHPVNFIFDVTFPINDLKGISPLVSSPVLIQVFEIVKTGNASVQSIDVKSKKKVEENSKRESKVEEKLIGLCNIDLLPLVLGETSCDEKLVLETPLYSWEDNNIVSWTNLPRISITMKRNDSDVISQNVPFNLLNITVESIFNLPSFFNKYLEYRCGTVIRTDDDAKVSGVIFNRGKWSAFGDVDQMKSWKVLEDLKSRARFSKYKISCDCAGVKSSFKQQFDLKTAINRNEKRIEWNSMHRTLLDAEDVNNIMERLKKHKYWPFEIMISENDDEEFQRESDDAFDTVTYQCYVDIRQLLFPGTTKTRILTQLHTQSLSKMKEKTGLSVRIFDDHIDGDDYDKRSKRSNDLDMFEYESQDYVDSLPVFTEKGEPVLILIEFEVYRPFIAARVLEDYTEALEILKNKPKNLDSFFTYTPELVHDQYIKCINQLIDVLGESYRDFVEHCECQEVYDKMSKCPDQMSSCKANKVKPYSNDEITCPYYYIQDELSRFKQYLHESGQYVSIRSKLKNKIINLLDQKFALNSAGWYSTENQNFVASCYTYLVEQMHTTLNTKLDVRLSLEPRIEESPDELWFRAEEAYEFEDYEKADKLFTKLVSDDRKNPDMWMRYAAHFMRRGEIDEAIECCREAIELNSRHKIALLFYGILLAMQENYTDAEIFLKAVLHIYPRFAEGWAVLHLFYVKIQYYPGIDLTLDTAEKCLHDRTRDLGNTNFLSQEPIAWSTMLCKKNRIFHLTAVLLLKLNLCEFADMAMTQELCHSERSVEFLYFSSVSRYLQNDYEHAIELLSEAETIIGLEYSIAALRGHSYQKLKCTDDAVPKFETVDMMYDRPESIHLVHLRLGFYYVDVEDYERARNVFLRASRYAPTCKTWLGVGVTSYHLKRYEESEVALTEANRIDDEDAEVWAYLGLLNMALRRHDEFAQCYRQMVKNNLRSDKLWQLIKHSMDALDYSSPITVLEGSDE